MKYSIILLFVLSACFNEKSFIQPDLSSKPKNRTLRYDGIYCKVDSSIGNDGLPLNKRVAHINPILFFENSYFASSFASYHSNQDFQMYFKRDCYRKIKMHTNEGVFYVQNDTVYMSGKFRFYWRGKIPKFYIAHFRGYIKNADTITDWKMIPPYPDIDLEGNFYLLNRNQAATFIFKPLQLDSLIDPEKLWIIEEQKKKKKHNP